MSLVVGVDSYATIEEANSYLAKMYVEDSEQFSRWTEASDNTKEVLLRQSCASIDYLRFDGEKKTYGQQLQFPRKNRNIAGYGYRLFISQYTDNGLVSGSSSNDGLNEVKVAQIENAIWHIMLGDTVVNEQVGINIRGLTSKKAGSVAESYDRKIKATKDAINGIYTTKVYEILKSWVSDARQGI